MKTKYPVFFSLLCLFLLLSSCSINKMAIKAVSNALTGEGSTDAFTGDPDPQLVGDSLPFAIKLYETLLSKNPEHQGLLLTTGSLFVMYANAFVQTPAEMLDPIDYFEERNESLDRAKSLYLRGRVLLNSALDKKFPGFSSASVLEGTIEPLLKKCKKEDVPLLYWSAAGGLAAYSIDIFDFALGSSIPEWGAMMARAYELDPEFNNAAIDDFYILFYSALPESMGGDRAKAEQHFKLAVEKTKGLAASPYVSYASTMCIPTMEYEGDYDAFKEVLEKALAIDVDEDPLNRLVNVISQRKAKYMLDNAYVYFSDLPYDGWY